MPRPSGSLPRFLQIAELLVRDIAAGRLTDGERLPPEREMAAQLGVAIGTLRKALAEVEDRGLLQRVQGSGNYVRALADPRSIYAMFRLELVEGGGLPTARLLSLDRLPKPANLPAFGASDHAHRIRRLRFLGGRPAAVEEIWLDAGYAETVAPEALSESLYLFYREQLGLAITRAEDRVGLGHVPEWSPPGFGRPPGEPVPHILRIAYDADGRRAEVSQTWFDHNVARYVARLKQEPKG
ncbi:GntR family transcriptional regulator [Paracoccus sp. Z118]|uniref:GntR family transcriptional regulator n=1 Tax=Paracoccus sp. Z118 TaxID=2851017 RepID=UPI001C2BA2EE|nr:GntR family transcriptional regulator [Paracoccus sp. Z118]MBV0892556.1 GntR family transcriptional regulator [Paracoccus sp. Z118]